MGDVARWLAEKFTAGFWPGVKVKGNGVPREWNRAHVSLLARTPKRFCSEDLGKMAFEHTLSKPE